MAKSMGTTQFINAKLATDKPIFSRSKINHAPPHPVTHLVSSNRRLALILANRTVQRVDQTRQDDKIENLDVSKIIGSKSKVHSAFLDPMGFHLLLSLKPTDPDALPDLLYIPPRSTNQPVKPRMSSKARGYLVTSVAWNSHSNQTSTGPILMGTTRGLIFEADISTESSVFSSGSIEKVWKQVYDLGKGQASAPITGLVYHRVPKSKKFFILATTPSRLYQFQGVITGDPDTERPLLANVFTDYLHTPDQFLELPSNLKFSSLSFCYQPEKQGKLAAKWPLFPEKFGWMTEQGIYTGQVDPFGADTLTKNCQLIHMDNLVNPIHFILTEFHAIIVFPQMVRGVCLLNEQVVFEDDLDMVIKGIDRDPLTGTIYVYSDYSVHKYNLDHEDKHIWKVFLEKGDFEMALKYCQNDDLKKDQVWTKQASDLFDQEKYVESAQIYAQTRGGDFEAVALKFLLKEESEALLHYLRKRLDLIRPSEKTQLTMIIVWLVEIYLNKMGAKANAPRQTVDLFNEDIEVVSDALDDQTSEQLLSMMTLPKVADCVNQNRNTFYGLLASHGDKTNLIKFANVMKDHDRVIRYHLQDKEYDPVLSVLEAQLVKGRPDLFYQHGPTLMQTIPERFINSVMAQGARLSPLKMIPSLLVNARHDQELQAIRYLKYCVEELDNKDSAVHNYLLSLYIKHQPDKVWDYLQKFSGQENIRYDVKYILRLCCEKEDMHQEAVYLFCVLGQLEEAITVSLQFLSVEQAIKCLEFAQNMDDDKKKKLYLMIAEHVVTNENDIKQAMAFLQDCHGLVKVEDILPFFPDFVTIDHFKDAICDSLQKYSEHIQELKDEMEEAYSTAERIRQNMQDQKKKYTFVRATDKCCICQNHLMAKPFHIFINCGHKFHTECLIQALIPHLSPARIKRIEELRIELASKKSSEDDVQSIDSRSLKMSKRELLRAELDDLIASECIFCGELMIKLIDKPFFEHTEYEKINNDWL